MSGVELQTILIASTQQYIPEETRLFVDGVWFVFFVSLVAWMYALFLTFKQTQPSAAWINLQEVIGILIFVISVVLSEVKERI
jgi:hypothetical protein